MLFKHNQVSITTGLFLLQNRAVVILLISDVHIFLFFCVLFTWIGCGLKAYLTLMTVPRGKRSGKWHIIVCYVFI